METIGQEVRTTHIDIDNIDIVILLIEFSEDAFSKMFHAFRPEVLTRQSFLKML